MEESEADALRNEIARKLLTLEGPDNDPAFTAIHKGEAIFHGPFMRDAPDLQCAFASNYRVSWQTALLGVPRRVFEPNLYPWSGDHCSNDAAQTAGIFLSNRALSIQDPGLEDIAHTICALFDVEPPEGAEGRDLFR